MNKPKHSSGSSDSGQTVPAGRVVCPECGKLIFTSGNKDTGTFLARCDQCAYGSRFLDKSAEVKI